MKNHLVRVGVLMAVLLSLATAGATTAQAAPDGGPYAVRTADAYSLPTPASHLNGGIFRGGPVALDCWVDYAWVGGTNRWFRASGVGFDPRSGRVHLIKGYVSASDIGRQSRVGRC